MKEFLAEKGIIYTSLRLVYEKNPRLPFMGTRIALIKLTQRKMFIEVLKLDSAQFMNRILAVS